MKVIGVVGGMGSGKSTVVGLLSEIVKAYVINADYVGHEILKKGNVGYIPIVETFGRKILGEDEQINRRVLGEIVFSDPKQLQKLNKISHPLIYKHVKKEIDSVLKQGLYKYVIIDAALLIEIKLIELVDEVWGVYAPLDIQIERVMLRNGLSKEEAIRRISTQLPWEDIKKVINIEINNSNDINCTKGQIISLLKQSSKGIVRGE